MRAQAVRGAIVGAAAIFATVCASADITLYKDDNYRGDSRHFESGSASNLQHERFNDAASSVTIGGGSSWELCEDANFAGRCLTLGPGRYPSLHSQGFNDRISSLRQVSDRDSGGSQGSGATTVLCESHDGGRQDCEMNTSGEVVMSRQLSRSSCVEGQSWGLQRHSVWVDKGCRAEFTNRSARPADEARGSGPPSSAVRACNAVQDRYGTVETFTPLKPGWWELIMRYDDGKYVCNVSDGGRIDQFERLRNQ